MAVDNKMFDVAKPGKTAADPTSRPIIVGQGARIKQDPMVSTATPKPETTTAEAKAIHDKVIAPPEGVTSPKPKEETKSPAEPKQDNSSSEAAVVDAVVEQADKKEAKDAKNQEASEEDKARRQHIDNLIADKTYFLPVGHITRKKNVRNSLIFITLLLVVAAGAVYYAHSQGLIKGLL
jgi:hypothetical protein